MTILLNILNIIISLSLIAMGYLAPYIVLAFYARQRNTTIKSLISLKEKYKYLQDIFTLSKVEGWAVSGFLVFIAILHIGVPLASLHEVTTFLGINAMIFSGALLLITSLLVKDVLDNINGELRKQSIKI